MTIVEALKAKKIGKIWVGNRWLFFDVSTTLLGGSYIVKEDIGTPLGKVLYATYSEEDAVKWLIGEE